MNKYKFTETWFDGNIPNWIQIFEYYKQKYTITSVLELGCYEGKATTWLCENIISAGTKYDIIDTFKGSIDESGGENTKNRLKTNNNFIEENFKHNISFFPDINFEIYKGYSQQILPTFEPIPIYDFIYIDASHRSDDTFVDAYYAHKLLKQNGLLIFDDYQWKDPKDLRPVNSPQLGIDTFYQMYKDMYVVLFKGYQIGFIKK